MTRHFTSDSTSRDDFFKTNFTLSRPPDDDFCATTSHFVSNSTSRDVFLKTNLHIKSSSFLHDDPSLYVSFDVTRRLFLTNFALSRPFVDGFYATTRHFMSNSTPQDNFSRQLCASTRPQHVLLLTIFACRKRVDAQICQEKEVLWRWNRRKMTSRHAKIRQQEYASRTRRCAKLSWKVILWRRIRHKSDESSRKNRQRLIRQLCASTRPRHVLLLTIFARRLVILRLIRQLCASTRSRQVFLLTIFARRLLTLRLIWRHKTTFQDSFVHRRVLDTSSCWRFLHDDLSLYV